MAFDCCSLFTGSYFFATEGNCVWVAVPSSTNSSNQSTYITVTQTGPTTAIMVFNNDNGTMTYTTSSFSCSGGVFSLASSTCDGARPTVNLTLCSGSSSSSRSSSSSSRGGVVTTCCPNVLVPTTVVVTVTGAGALSGSYNFTFGSNQWFGTIGSCGGIANCFLLCGFGATWTFQLISTAYIYDLAQSTCNPFHIVWTNVNFSPCGGSSGATVVATF